MRDWFSEDDLTRIFDPDTYKSRKLPHSFWPPLLALQTGARYNEIAQLYLDDIINDDPNAGSIPQLALEPTCGAMTGRVGGSRHHLAGAASGQRMNRSVIVVLLVSQETL